MFRVSSALASQSDRISDSENRGETRRRLHSGRNSERYYKENSGESFEPTIDYVVTKIPKWAFEKFPGAEDVLGTQMKSVGEVMAIGRTFKESLFKGLRSLEAVKPLRLEGIPDHELQSKLARPNSQQIFLYNLRLTKRLFDCGNSSFDAH